MYICVHVFILPYAMTVVPWPLGQMSTVNSNIIIYMHCICICKSRNYVMLCINVFLTLCDSLVILAVP